MRIKTTQNKVDEAMDKIATAGGTIDATGSNGSVSIKGVKASFAFSATTGELTITITDKPWLVSESYVEGEIKKFFS